MPFTVYTVWSLYEVEVPTLAICLCNCCIVRVHTEPGKPGKSGKSAIFAKRQGKPGIVGELFIIFIQVREKSGKAKYLVYISFSLTIGIVVRKVVALIVASELYHLVL